MRDAVTKATAYATALTSKVHERAETPPLVEKQLDRSQIDQLQAKAAAMRAAKRIEERHKREETGMRSSGMSKSKIVSNWSSSRQQRSSGGAVPSRAAAKASPPRGEPIRSVLDEKKAKEGEDDDVKVIEGDLEPPPPGTEGALFDGK